MKVFSSCHGRFRPVLWVLTMALAVLAVSTPTLAQRHARVAPPQWRGDISRFHEHDWNLWRGGHWNQGRHDGRLGWWWVVGASWYFYPGPVYPYPSPWEPPPVVMVNPVPGSAPPPPPTQYWYYCEAAKGYYPYVSACPAGWIKVPATPGDDSPAPAK